MQVCLSPAKLGLFFEIGIVLYLQLGCVLLIHDGVLLLLLQAERAKHTDVVALDPVRVRFGLVHLTEPPAIPPTPSRIHGG